MGDIFDTIGTKGQKADIFDTLDVKGDIFDQLTSKPLTGISPETIGAPSDLPVSGETPPTLEMEQYGADLGQPMIDAPDYIPEGVEPSISPSVKPSKANWGEVALEAPVKSVVPSLGMMAGGLEIAGAERDLDKLDYTEAQIKMGTSSGQESELKKLNKRRDEILKERQKGVALFRGSKETMAEIQPDVEYGTPKYYVGAALQSVAQMAPSLTASIATGNPLPTMMYMGMVSGGMQYGELIEAGIDPTTAQYASLGYALAEGIPEAFPVGVMLKGGKVATRILKTMGAETAQEEVTELLQMAIDKGTLNPDMTWKEAKQRLKDVAIISPIAGGVTAGATQPFVGKAPVEPTVEPTPVVLEVKPEAVKPVSKEEFKKRMVEVIDKKLADLPKKEIVPRGTKPVEKGLEPFKGQQRWMANDNLESMPEGEYRVMVDLPTQKKIVSYPPSTSAELYTKQEAVDVLQKLNKKFKQSEHQYIEMEKPAKKVVEKKTAEGKPSKQVQGISYKASKVGSFKYMKVLDGEGNVVLNFNNPINDIGQMKLIKYLDKKLSTLNWDKDFTKLKKKELEPYKEVLADIRKEVRTNPDTGKYAFDVKPAKESVVTDEVAEHIGDVTPTIGLAIKKTAGKEDIKLRNIINKKKKKFAFPDKETEKRFSDSRGLTKETAISKTREFLGNLKNRFTRTFEHLPRTGEFARLQFDILKLQKQKGVASDKTLRNIQNITIKLDNMEYDLFGRKVILDDLVETAEKGKDLPFGFTTETLAKSKTLLEKELEKTPRVSDAVAKRTKIWNDIKEQYIPAMKDIGVDVSERLQNKNYFRHQVLEYASLKSSVKGTPLKKPKHRGFLKQRKGSLLDINTDYIQAEHEVMAQMLYDIEVAKTMKTIADKYDISKTVRKDAKEQGIADWREAVPEGYSIWQPDKGNTFFMADSIPSSLASKLENGALKELGLKKEDIKKVMAVGGKQQELVVKEEVAKTLEDLEKTSKEAGIVKLDREIHRRWKMWVLVSPRRWFKYNFRNITGDGDALFVGNPAALKKVPQAISELYKTMFHDKPMTKNLRDWFERGGINSTLQAQEMGELNQLKIFVDIHNKEQSGKSTIPMKIWKGYWKAARLTTDFREAIFRYAAFLDYIQQIESSKDGKPKNFGASKPEEIMALEDTKDKAYWLQNDLLGAYDRVSVTGQNLASFWYPFWRWKEVNFRRYTQFIKNAVNDKKVAETVGRKILFGTVVKSPLIAIRVGKFAIKATAFWSMIQAWNILMFPDEEDELSNEEKSRLHIIFGRDKDGKIIYFTRLGALGDFLAWFGLDGAPGLVSDYLNGRRTMKETAIEMAKSPVNAIAQGATPLVKTPLELTTGKSLFPDVTSPRAVRDKGLHFARSFGLAAEYKALAGLPSRPYKESLDNILAYKADPLQVAYYEILELKYRFLDKIGQGRSGSVVTPRGQALYNLKLAVRYEDKEAFKKYFSVYASYGGTPEDLAKALERLHPLTGLRRRKKGKIVLAPEGLAFLSTLSKKDQEKLVKAEKFYNTVLQGQNQKGE